LEAAVAAAFKTGVSISVVVEVGLGALIYLIFLLLAVQYKLL
jgi:hypothetical protein